VVDEYPPTRPHESIPRKARRGPSQCHLKVHHPWFISSGTYGRVYKAQSVEDDGRIHAIKKFKPDKEGDVITYTGISQSAIREIAVSVNYDSLLETC